MLSGSARISGRGGGGSRTQFMRAWVNRLPQELDARDLKFDPWGLLPTRALRLLGRFAEEHNHTSAASRFRSYL